MLLSKVMIDLPRGMKIDLWKEEEKFKEKCALKELWIFLMSKWDGVF